MIPLQREQHRLQRGHPLEQWADIYISLAQTLNKGIALNRFAQHQCKQCIDIYFVCLLHDSLGLVLLSLLREAQGHYGGELPITKPLPALGRGSIIRTSNPTDICDATSHALACHMAGCELSNALVQDYMKLEHFCFCDSCMIAHSRLDSASHIPVTNLLICSLVISRVPEGV